MNEFAQKTFNLVVEFYEGKIKMWTYMPHFQYKKFYGPKMHVNKMLLAYLISSEVTVISTNGWACENRYSILW